MTEKDRSAHRWMCASKQVGSLVGKSARQFRDVSARDFGPEVIDSTLSRKVSSDNIGARTVHRHR